MDPASVAVVASVFVDISKQLADSIISDYKSGKIQRVEELGNKLRNIIQKAYRLNAVKAQALENKLMNIGFIKSTPALRKAIDNAYKETKQQQEQVLNDENKLQRIELDEQLAYNNFQDAGGTISKVKKQYNNYQNKGDELRNETEEILKKYQN